MLQKSLLTTVAKRKCCFYRHSKNGLQQEVVERTNEAPLWLQRQKNRAHQSNNISCFLRHPQYPLYRIYNLRCHRYAIFGSGLLNTFKAILYSAYLCLKVPTTFSAITVCGRQNEARNIERGFSLGNKNVHFLREGTNQHEPRQPSPK
jgi:hypothetical protein